MKSYTVNSPGGALCVQELGNFTTPTNNEKYTVGIVHGELCVWGEEVGAAEGLVAVCDLPANWGGDDADLEQLIERAEELQADYAMVCANDSDVQSQLQAYNDARV